MNDKCEMSETSLRAMLESVNDAAEGRAPHAMIDQDGARWLSTVVVWATEAMTSGAYCSYCAEPGTREGMAAHMAVCEKHPMRALLAACEAALDLIDGPMTASDKAGAVNHLRAALDAARGQERDQ